MIYITIERGPTFIVLKHFSELLSSYKVPLQINLKIYFSLKVYILFVKKDF